ncbi:MAG: AI-2E family transporter [Clostridia bacterium]|nr:AI-2E family transporter [Clostridia bacterium]
MNKIFTQYIYSRLICCVIMAVVCSIILALLGEKYALLLGIFIGVMDMIPYFGSIIATIVSAVIAAISGGLVHAVWCLVALL